MAAKIDPDKKPTPMLEQYLKVREFLVRGDDLA